MNCFKRQTFLRPGWPHVLFTMYLVYGGGFKQYIERNNEKPFYTTGSRFIINLFNGMNRCLSQLMIISQFSSNWIVSSSHTPTMSTLDYNVRFYTCNNKKHRLFSRNVLFPVWPPPQDCTLFFLCENRIFSPLPHRYFPPCLTEIRAGQSTSDLLLLSVISSCSGTTRLIIAPTVSQ